MNNKRKMKKKKENEFTHQKKRENPGKGPPFYLTKNLHQGKDSLFNKWCQQRWMSRCRRMELVSYLSPCRIITPT
jgi:hypothetical protein